MTSFVREDRPTLVGMLRKTNICDLLEEIEAVKDQGIDAIGFQIETLEPSQRTEENFKKIFAAIGDKPSYVTNYIRFNPLNLTDEELTEELLLAARCGATLLDVRGDLYDRSPCEFTENSEAVKKQKELIKKIKGMGAQVLMSSHVLKYIPKDQVLKIALEQEARGANIVKIVTEANSEAELSENFKATLILKEKLKVPFLFLCNGTHCKKHRMLGPLLSNDMFLVVENSNVGLAQPTISEAKQILCLAGYKNLP